MGINNGRSVIPKSVVDWQIEENLAADFQLEPQDMTHIAICRKRPCLMIPVWMISGVRLVILSVLRDCERENSLKVFGD